jgi:hypothetical protein
MAEMEGKGLDYERFALGKLFTKFVRTHGIGSVLEIPAKGEKAMPSIYSLAFGQAGCDVTLVNAEPKSRPAWSDLRYRVAYQEFEDPTATGLGDGSFDLVWNFMYLAQCERKDALLREMTRLSRRLVMYIGVNRFNPGFLSHRTVHRIYGVPWTHGDVSFMSPFFVARYFRNHGLSVIRTGVVDTPPYPDSLGFRDMRLHRKNVDLNTIAWESRTLTWMKTGKYPPKIRFLYFFEWLPLPFLVKLFYAHLFYVLAEKPEAAQAG